MLIDSHAHLYDRKFARDYERVWARAEDAAIEHVVCISDRIETSRRSIALAQRDRRISAVVGIHPHYDETFSAETLRQLEALTGEQGVVAIGEIGLDYHYPGYDAQRQLECFRAQGHLAARAGLPLVIHCRDAYPELIATFQADPGIQRRGVIHCFAGDRAQAEALLELGFYLGIGGAVTYPQSTELREVVRDAGLRKILIETDAPYMPPQPKRGRRNEPAYIKYAVQTIAEVTGCTFQQVAHATTANASACFGLPSRSEKQAIDAGSDAGAKNLYLSELKLEPTATAAEWLAAIDRAGPASHWNEVVLTKKVEPLLEVARALKQRGARVRLDTDGLNEHTTAAELAGAFDAVTINLDPAAKPSPELLEFVEQCKRAIPDVALCVGAGPEVDLIACRILAEDQLKVRLRLLDAVL